MNGEKNADSDIEGMDDDDKLPDSKAWGKKKKDYYYTDYVDQDYGGNDLLVTFLLSRNLNFSIIIFE